MTPQRREEDQHGITPRSNRERIERLESRHRRSQIENRILYGAAILGAVLGAALYQEQRENLDRVQELRRERVIADARTDRRICQRGEVNTTRLIDTKVRLRRSDERLRKLLTISIARDENDPDPPNPKIVAAFNREIRAIMIDTTALTEGISILRAELSDVDCDRLPSARPFRGLGDG